jgi:hypothetical protein
VARYGIPVPVELEQHMAKLDWTMPAAVDMKGLEID